MTTVQAVLLAKTWDQRFHSCKALYFCPTKLLQLEIGEEKKKEENEEKKEHSHKQKIKKKNERKKPVFNLGTLKKGIDDAKCAFETASAQKVILKRNTNTLQGRTHSRQTVRKA